MGNQKTKSYFYTQIHFTQNPVIINLGRLENQEIGIPPQAGTDIAVCLSFVLLSS
jgi:hypothetical protein